MKVFMKMTKNVNKALPLLIFAAFFAVFLMIGLKIFDDYGPVSLESETSVEFSVFLRSCGLFLLACEKKV